MKTIAVIGGMGPESTALFYEIITRECHARTGGFYYPRIFIASQNFQDIIDHTGSGDEAKVEKAVASLAADCEHLREAGAEFGCIVTNTMHVYYDRILAKTELPLLHIARETAKAANADGRKKLALLGTRKTMRSSMYPDICAEFGIEVLVPPSKEDIDFVDKMLFTEFQRGKEAITPETGERYFAIAREMKDRGADGLILGCTELVLLFDESYTDLPRYDTCEILAKAALTKSLENYTPKDPECDS